MLYYDFQNYEEFKMIFGIVEHGNGVKSRKNRILLAAYKDKRLLKLHRQRWETKSLRHWREHFFDRFSRIDNMSDSRRRKHRERMYEISHEYKCRLDGMPGLSKMRTDLLSLTNVADAKGFIYRLLADDGLRAGGAYHILHLMDKHFFSDKYESDDMDGLCEDGTLNAIRYRNTENGRVFKMRAGKMFSNIWSCNLYTRDLPEQLLRWMGEEFVADWTEYARQHLCNEGYTLHVDDNFKDIYDSESCKGYDEDSDSFGSCMVNDDQWTFYRDAVKAKAAYLTDEDGMIVARCILFTEVKDQDGGVWRLAERQYAYACDDAYKRQLVTALIRGGHIDGYKRVGSSCHDGRDFVDNEGNSLADKMFSIECKLENGDTLSYQDSFKNYDIDTHVATNWGAGCYCLDTTSSRFEVPDDDENDDHEGEVWSDYENCYINEDDACYVNTRDDYFYRDDVVYAKVWDDFNERFYEEDCFVNDCIEIKGDYYYAGFDAEEPYSCGLIACDFCDDYVPKPDAVYSELTGGWYCGYDCCNEAEEDYHRDHGHVWSDWDEEWYEDPEDVIEVREWNPGFGSRQGYYSELTCSIETFNSLVEKGQATEFGGLYYVDNIMSDGEPAHLGQDRKAA